MANIKEISAKGWMPFDAGNDDLLVKFLGKCNIPIYGFNVSWTGKERMEPNDHGGNTCMLEFVLEGQEAVRWEYLDKLCEILTKIGKLEYFNATDAEEMSGWIDLLKDTV